MQALTVRRKIQLGVLGIILAILAASFWVTGAVIAPSDRDPGKSLREMAAQLDHFRRTQGEAMFAAISAATDDGELSGLVTKGNTGEGDGIARAFDRRSASIDLALQLDLQALVAPSGQVLAQHDTPPSVSNAIRELRSFREALGGAPVRDAVEYVGGEAYQISAGPFYAPDVERTPKSIVGVLAFGRKLSSFVREFVAAEGTSGVIVALTHDGRVFSSDAPPAQWPQLESALARRAGGELGTAHLWGVPHDVLVRDVNACGGACARIAQIDVFRSRAPMEEEQRRRLEKTALYLLATALVAFGGGWLLSRWITRPLERYVDATRELAKGGGDLTRRLEASSDDDLGRLGRNLNEVFGQIASLAGHVKSRAKEVGESSDEIRSASRALLDGAAEQAMRIQSTSAATTQMSSSIQQVASSATDANTVAQQSGAAVEDAVTRMSQIREAVDRAAGRMALLGETGKRIGTIVDTIHQIADQTSLLALNAAIEAAHAGEHGRGFTVVADAVGQLATRVDRSAKEIDELIGQIRAQTDEALRAMGDGKREVEIGTKLIADSVAGIQRVLTLFRDTAAAVKEQAIASDEIARNMDAVGRIAQEVLVNSRNAVAEGERLTAIATSLEEAVAGFRLDGDGPARNAPDASTSRGRLGRRGSGGDPLALVHRAAEGPSRREPRIGPTNES